MLDYLIVGQGIAGSMLAWFLNKANKSFLVIDAGTAAASSTVAAGLINPVTGRKYGTTWLADSLLPFAEKTYREIETALGERFYSPIPLYHLFDSVKAQNDWSLKCGSNDYKNYLANERITYLDADKVVNPFGCFEVSGAARIQAQKLNTAFRSWLINNKSLTEDFFDFRQVSFSRDAVMYKGQAFRKVVFCEGAAGSQNPYFDFIPYQLAKGEVLIVRMPEFYNDRVIKGEVGIVPWDGKDLYYIGATHHWSFNDALPSAEGRRELEDGLKKTIKSTYEVVEHRASVRPAVTGRRPFIGRHPQHANLAVFNGLGTKGFSLAPFCAAQLVEHMENSGSIMPDLDAARALK